MKDRRTPPALLFTFLSALLPFCLSASSPQEPSFRTTSSELVVLPVVVHDKEGRLVADLERNRFNVYDNGRRQDVAFFTNEDTPVSVGLVIDDSGSMGAKLPYVRVATLAFARSSHPDDEIFTIAFNDSVRDVLPGRSLLASNAKELETALNTIVPEGRTALYDALLVGLERLSAGTRSRRVLILISDGGDNASAATLKHVLTRAREANVTIYAIGLFGEDDPDRNPKVLKSLADATGGARFLPEKAGELLLVCQRIAREIRSGYTLGYTPPDRDGRYHTVRVQLGPRDSRGLVVRTRPGYFAAGASFKP